MSTNKKFRIQNGADIVGELSINDVTVIGADGKVVAGAIQDAVASLTAADIADLQSQVTAILGTSPETLDTLQEIVTAFQDADTNLVASVASNSSDIATINNTLTNGVATPSDIAALEASIGSGETSSGYLFVGAPQDDTDPMNDHGSVYAWTAESNYTQSIKLTAPVPTQYNRFGESIGFGGGRLAVLATGNDTVYLYDDISGTPVELSVPTSVSHVAIGDTHVAVGGYGPFAYLWELDNIAAGYTQIQSPNHTDNGFYFGASTDGPGIAIDGNTMAIGQRDIKTLWIYDLDNMSSAPTAVTRGESSFPSGVYASGDTIYAKTTESNGSIHAYNEAGSFQSTFTGSGSGIFAQKDIAVSGDYFVTREDGTVQMGNYTRGKVLVYKQSNLIATLDAPLSDAGNAGWAFGYGIEILGGNLFVGDYSFGDPASQEGRVYKYDLNDLNASPVVMQAPDVGYDDQHGIVLTGGLISTTASMDTSASTVFGAVNELHTEVDALTVAVASTADSTAVVDAIATSKSEAISTASADATSKANAAQAAAEATASADATSKATAAQTAAEAYADSVGSSAVASVIDAAPATLDTLNELAAALGDDANFASTVTASIATKADDTATTAALATKASQADLTAETSRATSAETINNQAIAILQNQVSGISTSSGSSNIEMTADVDMSTNKISNLGTPTSGTDATTKAYVDSASSAAIATASADATAKANSAEADAKAYADQVVASTVDAAPAALDTLNELAAALGDDANFASTVTASIATKANDAATTAALATKANDAVTTASLALKEDKTVVAALDSFVKGGDAGYVEVLRSGLTLTSSGGGFSYFPDHTDLETGVEYRLSATITPEAGYTNSGNGVLIIKVNGSTVATVSEGPSGGSGFDTFTLSSPATSMELIFQKANSDKWRVTPIVIAPEGLSGESTLETSATQVVPAINELHTELNALSSTQSGDQSNLQTQITAEVARASSAEAVNAANIVSETSARTSADAALESDIIGLQNQVGTIISGSPASLDTLVEIVSAFETADASLSGVITANGGRLTTAENNITALEADLTSEETARGAADATLQANIDAEAATRSGLGSQLLGYININGAAISAEETARTSADSTLQSNIDTESSDRAAAITAEETARITFDASLQDQINALDTQETASKSSLESDINAEIARATAAESGLQSQISNVLSNTDATALNSLAEIVAEFQSADSTLTGAVAGHGTRLTSLESSTSAILAWDTDNLSEGTNKFWTPERSKSVLTGGLCITYDSATGEIKIDEAEVASDLHVASSSDANALGGQTPSHYRIDVYDVNGVVVN